MSTLIVQLALVAAGLAVILVTGFFYGRGQRQQGRLEAQAEASQKNVERRAKQADVIAQHREPGDASRRLRQGDF